MTADAQRAPRPPYWAWPALLIGQLHRPLARSVRPDAELIHRLPGRFADDLVLPAIAVAVVIVFSWLRLGIRDVFTESLPFMALAVVIGLVAPALGVIIVLLHAIGDLARTLGTPSAAADPLQFLAGIGARLISYYLLWLLVVEIPLLARAVPFAALASARPTGERARRVVAIGSAVIAVGLMTFVWTLAVPILIRPVFTWSLGVPPSAEALLPVQAWSIVVIGAAVVATGGLALLRLSLSRADDSGPVTFEEFEDFELDNLEDEPSQRVEVAAQIGRHIFAVIILGGLISQVLDLVLLVVAVVVSRPLAMRLLRIDAVRTTLAWVPWILRFVIGFTLTYVLGVVATSLQFEALGSSELPIILAVALGLFLFQVLLNVDSAATSDERPEPAPGGAGAGVAAVVLALVLPLAAPAIVSAQEEITAPGPLTQITITPDLNCQVRHRADDAPEFFGGEPGACGTFVSVDGTLYSPASVPAGSPAVGTPFTPVSQDVSGAGTDASPFRITTVVRLGDTGLTLTEVDSYVVGVEHYQTDVQLSAEDTDGPVDAIIYRAGDCFLQNADEGFGSVDPPSGAVRCVAAADPNAPVPVPGPRIEEWVPLSPGSRYLHGGFFDVWSAIGAQEPFANTCQCDEYLDNGAGLRWSVTVPEGGSVTVSHVTNFSPAGRSIVAVPSSIPAGSAAGIAAVGAAILTGLAGSAMEQRNAEERSRQRMRRGGRRRKEDRGLRGGLVKRLRDGCLRDYAGAAAGSIWPDGGPAAVDTAAPPDETGVTIERPSGEADHAIGRVPGGELDTKLGRAAGGEVDLKIDRAAPAGDLDLRIGLDEAIDAPGAQPPLEPPPPEDAGPEGVR